MQENIDLT